MSSGSYLNKDARDTMLTATVAAERLKELTATKAVSAEERKLLRQAATSITKAFDLMVRRLGAEGARSLLRTVNTSKLVWMENAMADLELNKEAQYHFTTKELDPILDELMGSCNSCFGTSECAKRNLFERAGAPEYSADHKVCPYSHL